MRLWNFIKRLSVPSGAHVRCSAWLDRSSSNPLFVERALTRLDALLAAVWVVNPKLPVWRLRRPVLNDIGVLTVDSFTDDRVHAVNPRHVSWKNLRCACARPFHLGAQVWRIAGAISVCAELNRASGRPKVAVKFVEIVHVRGVERSNDKSSAAPEQRRGPRQRN